MEQAAQIRRHGNYIRIAPGLTATEGMNGNLPSLTIRRNGKRIKYFRGSSLIFAEALTEEDKQYLVSLAYDGHK